MRLEDKIKNISKAHDGSKLIELKSDSAKTIGEFWNKVVEPLLPDYNTMKKWHELLTDYVSIKSEDNVVFMIRKGNEEAKEYIEKVPADALRRGFLTKTKEGYWFCYNDNDLATYFLKMVLDGDIIDDLSANDLLDYLKTPNSIIRFNRSGKGGVEKEKSYYKIDGPSPQISSFGYTVAHIFDVNKHYYDSSLGFKNTGGEEALKSFNIEKGMYSDYSAKIYQSSKEIYYRDNYETIKGARKFLEAHMLRFLHPLNYFCSPKDNMNGTIYCEFTDHINNGKGKSRRFCRVSGYEHLLYYAHHKFKEKYRDIYDDYLKKIMLPSNTFDFFENSHYSEDFYESEIIDAQYGNPLYNTSNELLPEAKKTSKRVKVFQGIKEYIKSNNIKSLDELLYIFPGIAIKSSDVKDRKRVFDEIIHLDNGDKIQITNQIGDKPNFPKNRNYTLIKEKLLKYGIKI